MNTDQNRTIELDVRGLTCPEPVLRTRKALDSIDCGAVNVLTDDAACRDNLIRFAQNAGYSVDSTTREDGTHLVRIEKSVPARNEEPRTKNQKPNDAGTIVFITSDRIGHGADELGQLLMGLFLRTLSEMPTRPARLILANAGVKLAVESSTVLDHLHNIERSGVKIGVCGTCLDYYGLKDKIRAGAVANLYEVTEQLLGASKVISL
jgi:selenium metabolism protein YedF